MGRLFLKLYSMIALAAIIFFVGVANLDNILLSTLEGHYGNLSKGTYFLLEKRLENLPEEQWPSVIDDVNQGEGYAVNILPIESLPISPSKRERLNQGSIILSTVYDAVYSYKRIGHSNSVLEVPFEQSGYDHTQRLINSSFNLVEQTLKGKPESQWPSILEDLETEFDFPIILIEQHQEKTLINETERLSKGKVTITEIEKNNEYFYRKINNSSYILQFGPFDEPITLDYIQSIIVLIFSVLLALAVLSWVYPLWRDLKRLGASTKAFGQGDFSVRSAARKNSVLYRLGSSFNAMADRIQGLISSHKELTNAVSHELRTPIARLRFGMEMLQDSTEEHDRIRFMESMNADIDELDQLVAELLTYARFDRDRPALEFQRQEITPWLNNVIKQSKVAEDKLKITFEVSGEELKYARFDPQLLARALSNLLQNAKRYAKHEINITFSNDHGNFQLTIDDDGTGIPKTERENIFDAFKRLDASRDRGTGGYGLGLAIVQRISQWHSGEINVTDSPLGGARFVIRWPEENLK